MEQWNAAEPDPRVTPPGRTDTMHHAMVHDEEGPFCTCGFRPRLSGLWESKTEILTHVSDAKLAAKGDRRGGPPH